MSPLLPEAVSYLATAGGSALVAWLALRGKRVEKAGDQRVAEIANEPAFASALRQALADVGDLQVRLAEERGKVAELRSQLSTVTAERDSLSGEVELLRGRLEDSTVRLDELNEQLTSLASLVRGLIPVQPAAGPTSKERSA
jgi:chromosome segregation ATPase